jgi:hypothetical protein
MTIFGQQTISSEYAAVLLVEAGQQPVLLVNLSLTVTIYVGSDPGIQSTDATGIAPLGPLNPLACDGSVNVYGIAPSGQTAQIAIFPSGTQWSPSPIQSAEQLITAGLATASNQIAQNNSINAPSYGPITTTNPGTLATHSDIVTTLLGGVNAPSYGPITTANPGTLATHTDVVNTNDYLGASETGALVSATGISIAGDMKNAHSGVTTEIAALIATGSASGTAGGVPLLVKSGNLLNNATGTLDENTNVTLLNTVAITQPSFEIYVSVVNATGVTALIPCVITMSWIDSTTGLEVNASVYQFYAGSAGDPHIVSIKGPTNANELTLVLFNGASVSGNNITYAVSCWQHSRIFDHDQGHTLQATLFPTLTVPSIFNDSSLFLAGTSASLTAGSGETVILPFWIGKVTLSVVNAIADLQALVIDPFQSSTIQLFNTGNPLAQQTLFQTELYLPGDQCELEFINRSADTETMSFSLVGCQY